MSAEAVSRGARTDEALTACLWQALAQVQDPCMCLAGKGLSIADMGLITRAEVTGGAALIRLLFTDPACLFELRVTQAIKQRVAAIEGVGQVEIVIECDAVWTSDRLSSKAQARFAKDRERLLAAAAPRPGLGPSR